MKKFAATFAVVLAATLATSAFGQPANSDAGAPTAETDAGVTPSAGSVLDAGNVPPSSEARGASQEGSVEGGVGVPSPASNATEDVQLEEVVIGTGRKEVAPPAVVETTVSKDIQGMNAMSSSDVMKMVPNLHVRKLYTGSITGAFALRGNNVSLASSRTLVLVDGLPISNYLNGGTNDSPKWQMVSPLEIEGLDLIYGPFSAAYGGNSFGGTVLITTRMPQRLDVKADLGGFVQTFKAFHTDLTLPGYSVNISYGDRWRKLSYAAWFNRIQSSDQPIMFYSLGKAGAVTGNPVTGGYVDQDAKGADRYTVGSQGKMGTENNSVKLKLAYDLSSSSQVRLMAAFSDARTDRTHPETYLRNASGSPVYNGPVDVADQGYTLADNTFTYQKTIKEDLFYGLTYKQTDPSSLKIWAALSYYDTLKDLTLASSAPPPAARGGGAGSVTDKNSGSLVGDAKVSYTVPLVGSHVLGGGYGFRRFELQSDVWNASDWLDDVRTTLSKHEEGATQDHAVFVDDTWTVVPWWSIYLGGRYEWWKAFRGAKAIDTESGRITTNLPAARQNDFSPKISTTLSPIESWSLRGSLGVATRYPTVGELFYGGINASGVISNGNPDLRGERNIAKDVTVSRALPDGGLLRLTFFQDDVTNAILSQININTNTTYYQNVSRVRTRGLEFSGTVRKLPVRGLSVRGSLGFNDSKILENPNVPASVGKQFPSVPPFRGKLGIDYVWENRLMLTLVTNCAGRAYYNLDNSDVRGGFGSIDSYVLFDAKVSYLIHPNVGAYAGVDNITDQTYYEYHPFPGRTFFLGVRANYGEATQAHE